MYIFIDESGSFMVPRQPNKVSCVVALIIPESFASTLFRKFRRLTREWREGNREVKGSDLDEHQVAKVIGLLKRFDVICVAACVDMGLHSDKGITDHKSQQADRYLKAISDKMNPKLKAWVLELENQTRSLSNQLFVQATLLNDVVDYVLRLSTLYYAQRIPKTLGDFRWVIDAKDRTVTPYEELWKKMVNPAMQYKSLKDPMVQIAGADYSAFSKFQTETKEPPEYLKAHVGPDSAPFMSIDLREILSRRLLFADSKRFTGLQLADILANALTRACNGNLQETGWAELGRIMVQNRKGKHSVSLLALQDIKPNKPLPYAKVINSFDKNCKQLLAGKGQTAAPGALNANAKNAATPRNTKATR